MSTPVIQYINRAQIDPEKWDRCILRSPHGLIYATVLYLDHMAGRWDALVLGDYELVMPLPWKRRLGIKYLYWVPFTQQLGVFGAGRPSVKQLRSFLDSVQQHFNYGEIFFNYANEGVAGARMHTNLVLPLPADYAVLRAEYKQDLIRNLDKAGRFPLRYCREVELSRVLRSFRQNYAQQIGVIGPDGYARFERLCRAAQQQGLLLLRGVLDGGGNWLATALLFCQAGRMYLLHSSTEPAGRKVSANHFLIDQLIREFAGRDLLLDFEGSDLPGIAHFYRNFGALDQPYYVYHFNHLPSWIRWLQAQRAQRAAQ